MAAMRHDLQRLCEASWRLFAEATKDEQHRLAERFLSVLGWHDPDPVALLPFGSALPTVSYVLQVGDSPTMAAHFLAPGLLQPPSLQATRGLDFCEVTRELVDITGAMGAQYAFITDLQKSCLYDAENDELLLRADIPAEFTREFGNVLTLDEVAAGSLEDIRRQPCSMLARQLREWCQRWSDILVRQARMAEDKAQLALDRLLVLRYLFYHDILDPEDWNLEGRVADLLMKALSPQPGGTGWQLRQLFSDLWNDWRAEIFAPDAAVDEILQHDRIAVPMLREYALLSQGKFTLPTILESFNYGEAAEKARVRTIPEEQPARNALLARQTSATAHSVRMELDINEEGYRTIFHWFDKLIDLYDRMDVEFRTQSRRDTGVLRGLDLLDFGKSPGGADGSDKFRYAVENGLVIYYATPRQQRTARILLYLHLIACYEESGERFTGFPSLRSALQPRPRLLDTDRQRIYSPPESYDEWEVI
ncbi:MAG: hypothetical protein RBU21_22875 [FCB group bacterium]|jgi:hypothetical protein|nr:hypothetical protein [FCB group bacterium]